MSNNTRRLPKVVEKTTKKPTEKTKIQASENNSFHPTPPNGRKPNQSPRALLYRTIPIGGRKSKKNIYNSKNRRNRGKKATTRKR